MTEESAAPYSPKLGISMKFRIIFITKEVIEIILKIFGAPSAFNHATKFLPIESTKSPGSQYQ